MALCLTAVALARCTEWVDVKATELPKLNPMAGVPQWVQTPHGPQQVPMAALPTLQAPDGQLVPVVGFGRLLLWEKGQRAVAYSAPLEFELHDGDLLDVRAQGQRPVTYALPNLERVVLERTNVGMTTAALLAVTLGATTLGVLALIASTR